MAEAKKYLDQQGLSTFWEKVKAKAKSEAEAAQTAAEAKAAEVATDLATNYYDKTDTDSKITAVEGKITALGSVMNYKGTKATTADLPATDNKTGDVWHVTADSGEYAWDGTEWQELGSTIDLSGCATAAQGAKADTALQDADLVAITTEYINALM